MSKNYKLSLLYFILFISFKTFSQTITRGPYLQKGTTTSVVIKWRTDTSVSSIIEYSVNNSYSSSFSDATPKTEHELEITGLSPDTKYFYRFGSDGSLLNGSTDLYFNTHPSIGTSDAYRFWLLGCTYNGGTDNTNAVDVRDAFYTYNGSVDTDGILFLGDNAGSYGLDPDYQHNVFDMYGAKLKNSITWSCLGNHDGYSANSQNQTGPYYDIFTFPTNGESGGMSSGTESYYSFDYGNIHFIVLNSFDENRAIGSTMYSWAENDIQNTTQKWIVAFWHHPPYSKGYHPSEDYDHNGNPAEVELIEMRENFVPMLESNGIDLVIASHSLTYERSYLISGHYGISDTFDPITHTIGTNGYGDGKADSSDGAYSKSAIGDDAGKGTVYVATSTTTQMSPFSSLGHNAMYFDSWQYGSCILEVDGNNLTLKFLRNTNVVDDYFTLRKGTDYVYENGWQGGTDPNGNATVEDDIFIQSGDATLTSNTNANIVVVNPEASLVMNSSDLTANNIILKSISNKYSSLISNGTITGTVNYDRYVNEISGTTNSNNNGNDLVSSPVTGEIFDDTFVNKNPALAENPGNIGQYAFAPFTFINTPSGAYENYDIDSDNDNTNEGSFNLASGTGYRVATTNGSPLRFSGTVNTGTVSAPVVIGKWNLIGNPYPSYIKVNDGSDGFLNNTANISLLDETNVGIYGYDGTNTGGIWTTLNLANTNSSTVIAPGQGFFVNVSGTGSDIEFTSNMRTIGSVTDEDFIVGRNSSTMKVLSKLQVLSGSELYSTDIYFINGLTKGLDPGYDAGAFQGNAEGIFTNLVEENSGIEMAIQALPYDDYNDVVVPLGIKATSGTQLSIGINEVSTLSSTINVYLEDNVTNTFTLLNSNDYSFTAQEDIFETGRFFVHYSATTLSVNNQGNNGIQIFTSANSRLLNIKGKMNANSILDLIDIQGRRVLSEKLNSSSYSNTINLGSLNSGIYIVKLTIGNLTKTQKVIIK